MTRLRLHERRDPLGRLRVTWLMQDVGPGGAPALSLVDEADDDPRPLPLPAASVIAAFERYGKALAAPAPPVEADDELILVPLSSGGSGRLRAFAFRGYGSVLPEDYLLLERDGEPLAGPAPLLAAALAALARAAARAAT